jgi:hypothetical protein
MQKLAYNETRLGTAWSDVKTGTIVRQRWTCFPCEGGTIISAVGLPVMPSARTILWLPRRRRSGQDCSVTVEAPVA